MYTPSTRSLYDTRSSPPQAANKINCSNCVRTLAGIAADFVLFILWPEARSKSTINADTSATTLRPLHPMDQSSTKPDTPRSLGILCRAASIGSTAIMYSMRDAGHPCVRPARSVKGEYTTPSSIRTGILTSNALTTFRILSGTPAFSRQRLIQSWSMQL